VSQIDIFGEAKPLVRVGRSQEAVLKLLADTPDGCSADEIGAAIHAARGKHAIDEICRWCGPDSRDVVRALEKKQLIRRTSNGQFVLRIEQKSDSKFGGDIPY